ncbi:putative dicarboxylate transporter 2.1, chloroplastic [Iris pallida]|uniref:Dicarboxylate transporter 2.1, chloroplastic n=1 Tax=Iris pallida TaxID=29817 RepID=A0AAX6FFW3_IRIPA|nr:putative dicarboxylate transporter 2.1, chloroplastic [Iris pallida]
MDRTPSHSLQMAELPTAASPPATPPPPSRPWQGVKPIPLLLSVSVGLVLRFAVPRPGSLTPKAWSLLAIFLSTIAGLVLSPLPVGAWAFAALTVLVVSRTLPFAAAFAAYTNEVIWLIVISFFFARGFVKTGLGERVATYFVKWLGRSTLGLSYGLAVSEALMAPAMPSTTARAGGVFSPIIRALALTNDSRPSDESARRIGSYLIMSQLQASSSSSALFLTGAAQNLLCLELAKGLGVKISSPWVTWFKYSSLPAITSLVFTPYFIYKIFPPEIKNTPEAPPMATKKLEEMGPMSKNEWAMVGTMVITVSLWIAGGSIGMPPVVAAMLGLTILLLVGVLDWNDCLSEKSAWDTLAWFGVVVGMANQLTSLGVVAWMSGCVEKFLQHLSINVVGGFFVLQASYLFIHYLFASQTAHVAALYSAFLGMHLANHIPGLFATLALAYNTNLNGALTHYSSGQAAVYYGSGYLRLPDIFRIGILTALFNILIWGLVGSFWWKVLGLY